MALPKIRTIKQGMQRLQELRNRPITTGKKGNTDSATARAEQIQAARLAINQLRARYKKGRWVEMDFGDLPPGTVFKTEIALSEDKANQSAFGRPVYGAKSSYCGSQTYSMMKSSGDACFVLSAGMDQGSMLSLSLTRPVLCRAAKKVLSRDTPIHQKTKELMESLEDEFCDNEEDI